MDDAAAKGVIPRGARPKVVAEEEGSFISDIVLLWNHLPPELQGAVAAGASRVAEEVSDRLVRAVDSVTRLMKGPKVVDAQLSPLDQDLVRVTLETGEFRDVTQSLRGSLDQL